MAYNCEAEIKSLENQRNLLGDVLGRILVAQGIVNPMPLTGPELLMVATDYANYIEIELEEE